MVEINWTNRALNDIDAIAVFISQNSEVYSIIQTQRFFYAVQILTTHSFAGRIVPEKNNKKIREIILGNYRMIYKIINKNRIDIITIHHSAMRLRKM